MTIAENRGIVPLELRLDRSKDETQVARMVATCALRLKWGWWHTKSYVPIVAILVLALGSLLMLQVHWLYRRLAHLPTATEDVLNDAG